MKILPVEMIRQADAYTIENEPVASIDLMERAARSCYDWLRKKIRKDLPVHIFCGTGNNGGDGLALARMLSQAGYQVNAFIVGSSKEGSPDFKANFARLEGMDGVRIREFKEGDEIPVIPGEDAVIDAIFGSGLARPVEGFAADVIRHINDSGAVTVAIDIPSGLFADKHSDEKSGAIVHADYTLSFEAPKLAFMFAENDKYVGDWIVRPIGLHPGFIGELAVRNFLLLPDDIRGAIKPRPRYSHKGTFGHALLISGSYGKMGAALLSSAACLRSGVGLLHAHVPVKGYSIIQTAVPEAMVSIDPHEEYFSRVPELGAYTAVGIGPGIGFAPQTQNALKLLIQNTPVPLLFDADAITILGENRTWLSFVPPNSIFTPHPKEFERITVKPQDDFHRLELLREFAVRYRVYMVLKGAHSAVCFPDGSCYFNTTGNPGMATGGTGDVLTGLILGLSAQGHTPGMACLLGVYLHGLAGDLAASKYGMESMTAGDVIRKLGKAFKKLAG